MNVPMVSVKPMGMTTEPVPGKYYQYNGAYVLCVTPTCFLGAGSAPVAVPSGAPLRAIELRAKEAAVAQPPRARCNAVLKIMNYKLKMGVLDGNGHSADALCLVS